MSEGPLPLLGRCALPTNIPAYRDADGSWWTNPLWAKDLLLQAETCERLIVVCPSFERREMDWVPVSAANLEIRALPLAGLHWLGQLPTLFGIIDRAVDDSEIVWAGVAGWPFPLGWLATISARRRQRFLVVNVESAPWRAFDGSALPMRARLGRWLFERHARFCAARADALTVTQPEYYGFASDPNISRGLFPASWIDADMIVSPEEAARLWDAKSDRLFHGGRLNEAKGTGLLLDALEALGAGAPPIDIAGFGPLEARCAEVAGRSDGRVRIVPMVGYGADFSALLDRYQAVILPQLSDEQPRLLFDAFARATPVIASDRKGMLSCMTPDVSGWTIAANDGKALKAALVRARAEPATLRQLGLAALHEVAGQTHQAMQRDRAMFLAPLLRRWRERRGQAFAS